MEKENAVSATSAPDAPAEGRRVKLAKRLLTSAVLIGLTVWVLFYAHPVFFFVELGAFIGLALYEFFALVRKEGIPVSSAFGLAMGLAIPSVVFFEFGQTQSGEILFLVLGCLCLFILKFFRANSEGSLAGIALTLFGILYVSWFLSFLIKIRFLPSGALWVAFVIATTKASDIGAYAVGTLFGKRRLMPHVSPKKTVEGLWGGLALSSVVAAAFAPVLPLGFDAAHLAVIGFVMGAVGQIGDLSESLMKRCCHAKDSGGVLPGMGGVLDAVDSILFTAPIFYFYLTVYQ